MSDLTPEDIDAAFDGRDETALSVPESQAIERVRQTPAGAMLGLIGKAVERQPAEPLARAYSVDRMKSLFALAMLKNPKIAECTPHSVIQAFYICVSNGLDATGANNSAHLIPRWNGQMQAMECTVLIGYNGLIDMAMRHPRISHVDVEAVYREDAFAVSRGTNPAIHHSPDVTADRNKNPVAYYAVAHWRDGAPPMFAVMTAAEVETIRKRLETQNKGKSSPAWAWNYAEMGKKTVVRRLCKMLPLGSDANALMEYDAAVTAEADRATSVPVGMLPERGSATIDGDDPFAAAINAHAAAARADAPGDDHSDERAAEDSGAEKQGRKADPKRVPAR